MNIILPTNNLRFSQAHRGTPQGQQARRVTPTIYANPHLIGSQDDGSSSLLDFRQNKSVYPLPPAKRRRLLNDDCSSRPRAHPLDLLKKPKRQCGAPVSAKKKATAPPTVENTSQKKQRGKSRKPAQSLPGLPANPYKKASSYRSQRSLLDPVGIKDLQVRTRYEEIEPPGSAPGLLHPFLAADYHLWVGSDTEDKLSSETIAQGYHHKPEISHDELGSSRSAVYKQLNQPSNLEVLSAFLTSVIQSKEILSHAQYYSLPSQPRRVALTDTKREAWLRDLANPAVPLDKLSRTVPNGIRAKNLFEQCLSKLIPLDRAIWLVKNASGSENRMSRKLPLNEVISNDIDFKLAKEWAASAYQFLENVLTSPIDASWRPRTKYAIHLCGQLLHQDLVDPGLMADIYLDSLGKCSTGALPLRLLLLATLFPYMGCSRHDARELANCLNHRYKTLSTRSGFTHLLSDKIKRFLKRWVRCGASASVLATDWLISNISSRHSVNGQCGFDCTISHFLAKIAKNCGVKPAVEHLQSSSEKLLQILDRTPLNIDTIISLCSQYPEDLHKLAYLLLAWASSTLRSGIHRIYLVVSVFQIWGHAHVDLHEILTSALAALARHPYSERSGIYHVISELVRHYSLSMSRYLQWIMARRIGSDESPNGLPLEIELLANLPSSALPRHIWNLRNNLLLRFGFSVSEEHQLIKQVRYLIQRRLPTLFSPADGEGSDEIDSYIDLGSLSRTVKVNVAVWLRDAVCQTPADLAPPELTDNASKSTAFTVAELWDVRNIFEQLEDIPMLADILEHAACSRSSKMVAAVLQTLSFHLDSLMILDRAGHIFSILNTAVVEILETSDSFPEFVGQYLSVATEFSIDQHVKPLLRRTSSIGKGSIHSKSLRDSLFQSLDTSKLSHWSDIRSFSQHSVAQATIDRLLTPLCSSSPKTQSVSETDVARIAALVYQLRLFDTKAFDHSLLEWVSKDLMSPKEYRVFRIMPFLVGVGAITVQSFFDLVSKVTVAEQSRWSQPELVQFRQKCLLALLPNAQSGMLDEVIAFPYSFEKSRQSFLERRAESVLLLLQLAHKDFGGQSGGDGLSMDNVRTLLCELFIHCPASIPLSIKHFPSGQPIIFNALGQLLECGSSRGITAAKEAVIKSRPFSVELCNERLRMLITWEKDDLTRSQMEEILLSAYLQQELVGATFQIDPFYCLLVEDLEVMSRRMMAHALFLSLNSDVVPKSYTQSANHPAVFDIEDVKNFFDFYLNPDAANHRHDGTKTARPKYQFDGSTESMSRNTFALLDISDNEIPTKTSATRIMITNEPVMLLRRLQALLRLSIRCSFLLSVNSALPDHTTTSCNRLIYTAISFMLPLLSSDELRDAIAKITRTAHNHPKLTGFTAVSLQAQASGAIAEMIDMLPNEAMHQCASSFRDQWVSQQWDPCLLYVTLPLLRDLSARLFSFGGPSSRSISPLSPADSFISFGLDPSFYTVFEQQRSDTYQENFQLSAFSQLTCDPTVFDLQILSFGA